MSMSFHNIDIAHLPSSIQDMVAVIGLAAALVIVEERGGIRLCVPAQVRTDHWLMQKIGAEAFVRLVQVYAGEEIEIPKCDAALRALREHEIVSSDESNARLARRYGYTERGIRKLKRRVRNAAPDDQQSLF